jgi:magnesium transporter
VHVLTEVDPDVLRRLQRRQELFWLDLVRPTDTALSQAADALALHPMGLEDSLEWGQRPKLDDYGDHVLLVFFSADQAPVGSERAFAPIEVHLYIAARWLFSVRREPSPPLDGLQARLREEEGEPEGYFVYQVLDALTNAHFPVIAELEDRLESLERDVLTRARDRQLRIIYRLRQDVHALERRLGAQKEGFPAAAQAISDLPGIGPGVRAYLRDVGDHLARAAGDLHRLAVDLSGLTDTYFNANANRLNAAATRLTVIATFFLVWTLVTGFFGQNFGWLVDHIQSLRSFLVYGVGSLVLPTLVLGVLLWRRRSDWL